MNVVPGVAEEYSHHSLLHKGQVEVALLGERAHHILPYLTLQLAVFEVLVPRALQGRLTVQYIQLVI